MENNTKVEVVFIKDTYFQEYKLKEIMDEKDPVKRKKRLYLYLKIIYKGNTVLVPLRSRIDKSKINSKCYYSVPMTTRPEAGLDFRKALIINDEKYIDIPESQKLAKAQSNIISTKYTQIVNHLTKYIDGYYKVVEKNRQKSNENYKFSTLVNFHFELGLESIIEEIEVPMK